jgi:bacillithiol biosynthesis cysteine-adding enzyme BshC
MTDNYCINFSSLPHSGEGFSDLFCDYIDYYQKLQHFFPLDFRKRNLYAQLAEDVCKRFTKRTELVSLLQQQNHSLGSNPKTFEHIQLLGESNTVAIVTGQQVGMLGGPLYTIYKTITAIKLAEELKTTLPDLHFVPVFWLEGEDHDFQEMNNIGLLDTENQPKRIEYLHGGTASEKNIGAIGEVVFDEHLKPFFEQIHTTLLPTEFRQPLLDTLQSSYKPQVNFNYAFASWMNSLFPDAGLVFISSNSKEAKELLKHLFVKELNEFPAMTQRIIEQSAKLEDEYHAQIKPRALNLFCFHKGGRYLIEPREHDFSLKGIRQYFSKEEMLKLAEETPEFFSPNVALRPICQDTLLPTLAYVAGPSEVAYFAQLKSVYAYFNIPMPVIYPRASATLLEQRQISIINKYGLKIETFLKDADKVASDVIGALSEVKVDDLFGDASRRMFDIANELKFGLEMIDPTLIGPLENTQAKLEEILVLLKNKAIEAQRKKHEVALRQISRVSNNVFPDGTFQERYLNLVYFLNKYGLHFHDKLMTELSIDEFKHQFIPVT